MIDNRDYFEVLAKEMKDTDLSEVYNSIDIASNNIEEVVETVSKTENLMKLAKINAFVEKYDDDILDLRDEIKLLEQEYQVKINAAIEEYEEANRKRIEHIKAYDDFNRQSNIENFEQDKNNEISARIEEIEKELRKIYKKEELLNGQLSKRMIAEKETLEAEKAKLKNTKVDIKDSKAEAYYLANGDEKVIKAAQNKRNEIIKELAVKKVDLYRQLGDLRKNKKKYLYVSSEILKKIMIDKRAIDIDYAQTKKEFENKIASGDLNAIAEYASVYKEASDKKIEADEKYYKLSKILDMDFDSLEYEEGNKKYIELHLDEEAFGLNSDEDIFGLPVDDDNILTEEEKMSNSYAFDEIPTNEIGIEEPKMEPEVTETIAEEIVADNKAEEASFDNEDVLETESTEDIQPFENDIEEETVEEPVEEVTEEPTLESVEETVEEPEVEKIPEEELVKEEITPEENENSDEEELVIESLSASSKKDEFMDNLKAQLPEDEYFDNEPTEEELMTARVPNVAETNAFMERLRSELPEDEYFDNNSEEDYYEEELEEEEEDYGFETNAISQPIEDQPEQPLELNDVMTIEQQPSPFLINGTSEQSPFTLPANPFEEFSHVEAEQSTEEEPALEPVEPIVKSTVEPVEPIVEPVEPIAETTVEPVEENVEVTETVPEEEPVVEEPKEKHSKGGLFKLFGKKEKNDAEHTISNIEDASTSTLDTIADLLHKRYLDTEGYETWKANIESNRLGR